MRLLPPPFTRALTFAPRSLKAHLATWRHKYESAQDIVLAGGGAVGIETAGEIMDIWPEKNVTVVHGGAALLNDTYPAKFRAAQAAGLTARGVQLILGDYVDDLPAPGATPAGVTTRNGRKLNADLVVRFPPSSALPTLTAKSRWPRRAHARTRRLRRA